LYKTRDKSEFLEFGVFEVKVRENSKNKVKVFLRALVMYLRRKKNKKVKNKKLNFMNLKLEDIWLPPVRHLTFFKEKIMGLRRNHGGFDAERYGIFRKGMNMFRKGGNFAL